eukprot:CAMPEP_0180209996 /NCGR_PEP_ID=MMETSP0987-20121128/11805_1 /TAXON_ID=697907 /ORGANISM="non described non described, Strain CCMP2293" /LENGTH=149 /DNA_ID=CAMNT_0022166715 /DNA_START=96 /DNA_END=542 /DNA_ORIENTATION=-
MPPSPAESAQNSSTACLLGQLAEKAGGEGRRRLGARGARIHLDDDHLLVLHCAGRRAGVLAALARATTVVEERDHRREQVLSAHHVARVLARSLRLSRAEEGGRDGRGAGALDGNAAASRHLHDRVEGRGGADERESNALGGEHPEEFV